MMARKLQPEELIAAIDVEGCLEREILAPLEPKDEIASTIFRGWDTPLAPWGGFGLQSRLKIARDCDRTVLEFDTPGDSETTERALVTERGGVRDARIVAQVKCIDSEAKPNTDRSDYQHALAGIVFRWQTSRRYYQFGIEGRRRAVLYRRSDDEWLELAHADLSLPDNYVTLEVALDGDGIRCRCDELAVDLFATDTTYTEGKIGVRSVGRSRLASLRAYQDPSQRARDRLRRRQRQVAERGLGDEVPEPVLVKTLDLSEIGGVPTFHDFAESGRFDILTGSDGLRAQTVDGDELWELPFPVRNVVFSPEHTEKGRLIYGLTGERTSRDRVAVSGLKLTQVVSNEMVVIRGGDGEVLARAELPELHEDTRQPDFSPTSADLTGNGPFDIVLREWRQGLGDGGRNLWAYDQNLNSLWHATTHEAPYGHHAALRFLDINGDGRDELLAGGTMFDCEGGILWEHDREPEMARIAGAHHYDAVALGNFTGDESVDPVAFLLGGSAGVYVVDALTGETRMAHRTGHAQGVTFGKVRSDLPGEQVLAAMRWGNMGILTLFSGSGDRLWTIQPDYIGQGATPVSWGEREEQLIWTNTSARAQALYDGHGRRVKELAKLQSIFGDRVRKDVGPAVIRMGADSTEYLTLTVDGRMHIFKPQES